MRTLFPFALAIGWIAMVALTMADFASFHAAVAQMPRTSYTVTACEPCVPSAR